ncbi:RICIN domain-containing protein [Streptomyces sp. NPDC051976]|uniref:RICIN domain-containing protein n=1 Tax=Streptomyces sp. NPDC051976 TaxID=3154947 RepID=UPI0034375A3E
MLTAVTAAAVAASTLLAAPAAQAAPTASTTLVVNADQPFRPVTHVAAGSLYGLADDSTPADSVSTALHANTYVQMAPGGRQLPNGEPRPAGDALTVARKAAAGGSKVIVRMPDWYPNFPYKWVSWSDWLSAVDTQIASVKASGATDISGYELWNEPDWTWNASAAGDFDNGWVRTYGEVRARTTTPVVGPSFSHWDVDLMRPWLTYARDHHAVPEVISWHELGGDANIAADVAAYRSLESSLGISARPISIEEYGTPSEVGVPGSMVGYVAKFERAGVSNAEMAFWNHYGTLGDTLTDTGGAPNGAYWLYKWYGDMTGNMVTTVPPNQTGIDGAADVSSDGAQVGVVFGGAAGSSAVKVNGLNALPAFGGTVHVKLEYTANTGRLSASAGPLTISEADYPVTGGSITVPVTTNGTDGYHLVVTPTGTSATLAGTYRLTNVHSGLALDTQNAGTASGTLVVQATSGGGTGQSWQLVAAGSGLYKVRNVRSGLLLGVTNASTDQGQSALIWGDNGTPDHLWQLIPTAAGTYKFANYNSGLLLGVTNMSTSSGAQVLQWGDNGTADHLWRLTAS